MQHAAHPHHTATHRAPLPSYCRRSTGMFAGIYAKKDALLRRLLLPILKPAAVSRAVVAATRAGDDAILVLPRFLWWVNALTRMLPVPLYDALVAFAGGAHGMEGACVCVCVRARAASCGGPSLSARDPVVLLSAIVS